ncbi:uncharacterized protein [Montipora foliosa]|uniref:uncharacterized protein n=1 Tax=Montipora foliosa TaxID=591990 RepID=UPI0035F1CD02
MEVIPLCLYLTVSFISKGDTREDRQTGKHKDSLFLYLKKPFKAPSFPSVKKSYMDPNYFSQSSYQYPHPSSYPQSTYNSYYSNAYPSPSSYPYTSFASYSAGYPVQISQTSCTPSVFPGTNAKYRSETFEVKGKAFKSIGCWSDSSVRAMESMEGKHKLLQDVDYKSRVNALMKCAEAAADSNFVIFALQNGGQCFSGQNAERTFRKYGESTSCCGDGEGGPWSNEVYSFIRNDGKPVVNASYSPWSAWSPCPQTCNSNNFSAIQVRNRSCFNALATTYITTDLGCGNSGYFLIESRPCQVKVCQGNRSSSTTSRPFTIQPPTPPTQATPGISSTPVRRISPSTQPTAVCTATVDLGFLIDGSGSIEQAGAGNFKKELNFVKQIVNGFKVSKKDTHVGVIIFSSNARVVSGFDEHYDKRSVLAAIESIPYPGAGTKIGKALDLASTQLYGKSVRSGIPNMLIVLTDGQSMDQVTGPAQRLRDSGVTIFAVGIGGGYNLAELKAMATDPDSQHVYRASFNNLNAIVQLIKNRACLGSGGTSQPAPPIASSATPRAPTTTQPPSKQMSVMLLNQI